MVTMFSVVVRVLLSGYHVLDSCMGFAKWLPHSFEWLLGCC